MGDQINRQQNPFVKIRRITTHISPLWKVPADSDAKTERIIPIPGYMDQLVKLIIFLYRCCMRRSFISSGSPGHVDYIMLGSWWVRKRYGRFNKIKLATWNLIWYPSFNNDLCVKPHAIMQPFWKHTKCSYFWIMSISNFVHEWSPR